MLDRLETAAAAVQPAAPGARPVLRARCKDAPRGDRRAAARGQHQSRPAGELEHAGGPLPADRRRRERRHRRGPCRDAEGPAAGGGDGHVAVLRRRSGAGRADHPRLPAAPRRPSRGHAAAGQDRHGPRRARRRRDAAGGGAGAGAGLSRGAPRLCPDPGPAAQVRARRATRSSGCWRWTRPIPTTARWRPPSRWAWASTTRRSRSTATCCADAPGLAGRASVARPCAEDRRPACPRRSTPTARRPRRGPISATPIGASPTSRPIASPTTRSRACAPRRPRRRPRWSTATTSASRSARRWRTAASIAESWRYYERGNALKRAESRYRPEIIETNTRQQIAVCTPDFFAAPRRLGRSAARPDLHPRPAALRLDPARADPRLAFAGRGHAGAGRHPAHRARAAGPRARSRQSALSGRPGRARRPRTSARLGETLPRRHRASTAPAGRSSSTRCRTISAISA